MISIIMPIYNGERFIKESIESVQKQSYKDWELIIVDDGSTDQTGKIILESVQSDRRIRYYYKSNGGVSTARNKGLLEYNGEYVMFLDSDDLLCENALMIVSQVISLHNSDLIVHPTLRMKDTSISAFNYPMFENNLYFDTNQEILQSIVPCFFDGKKNIGCICSWVFKKECIQDIQFDENLTIYEDMVFALSACSKANSVDCITDYLYLYRDNEQGAVKTFSLKKVEDLITSNEFIKEFHERHFGFIPEKLLDKRMYDAIVLYCKGVLFNYSSYNKYVEYLWNREELSRVMLWAKNEKLKNIEILSQNYIFRNLARIKLLFKIEINRIIRRH
jgi:glycosyltransferase involved in cell wall biosynthesis